MKLKLSSALLSVSLLFSASNLLQAQSPKKAENILEVSGGYLNFLLDNSTSSTSFTSKLAAQGIFYGFGESTVDHGMRSFLLQSGEADANTGAGEFTANGHVYFYKGSTVLDLQHLSLDTTGSQPVLSAIVVLSNSTMTNRLMGRMTIFTLANTSAQFAAGLQAGGNPNQSQIVPYTINQSFASFFNGFFNTSAVYNGETAGTTGVDIQFKD